MIVAGAGGAVNAFTRVVQHIRPEISGDGCGSDVSARFAVPVEGLSRTRARRMIALGLGSRAGDWADASAARTLGSNLAAEPADSRDGASALIGRIDVLPGETHGSESVWCSQSTHHRDSLDIRS